MISSVQPPVRSAQPLTIHKAANGSKDYQQQEMLRPPVRCQMWTSCKKEYAKQMGVTMCVQMSLMCV